MSRDNGLLVAAGVWLVLMIGLAYTISPWLCALLAATAVVALVVNRQHWRNSR